jgi:hypothetical protein
VSLRKNIKHRGEILRLAVNESGLSITLITKKARYSRSSYYNHVEDPELPYEVLERYGRALKHDFSEEFPQINSLRLEEEEIEYGRPDTLEKALQQLDRYKEKYYELLEKYNKLLEEKFK